MLLKKRLRFGYFLYLRDICDIGKKIIRYGNMV